jgi:hypothetical protein
MKSETLTARRGAVSRQAFGREEVGEGLIQEISSEQALVRRNK